MSAILDAPETLRVTTDFWYASATIAGLRQGSNDPIRGSTRHRGNTKNFENDLCGVVGELASLMSLEARLPAMKLSHDLFSASGPVDDVDIVVGAPGREFRLESKCLLLEAQKRYFLVNKIAHERSVARGAHGYIPVISAVGCRLVRVGRLLSTAEVDGLDEMAFQYGDPALGVRLRSCAEPMFGYDEGKLRRNLQSTAHRLVRFNDLLRIGVASREHASSEIGRSLTDVMASDSASPSDLVSRLAELAGSFLPT